MGRTKQILLVEGDPKIAQELLSALKGLHYEIRLASSAEEALMILETETADMVISDSETPGLDLRKFIDELLGWDTELPVIVLDKRRKALPAWLESMKTRLCGIVPKPIHRSSLVKLVQMGLAGKNPIEAF